MYQARPLGSMAAEQPLLEILHNFVFVVVVHERSMLVYFVEKLLNYPFAVRLDCGSIYLISYPLIFLSYLILFSSFLYKEKSLLSLYVFFFV